MKNCGRPTKTGSGVECKQCKKLVARWPRGLNTQKRTQFVCAEGRHWSGNVCPSCHNENRKYEAKSTNVLSSVRIKPYLRSGTKLRACISCGEQNVNYFRCTHCIAEMRGNGRAAWDAYRFGEINGECV